MTPEEKTANVALLARMVMDWPVHMRYEPGPLDAYPNPPQRYIWDPYTSIVDAMEMLDKLDDWQLYHAEANKEPAKYWCVTWCDKVKVNDGRIVEAGSSACGAICAACLEWARAQGGKG